LVNVLVQCANVLVLRFTKQNIKPIVSEEPRSEKVKLWKIHHLMDSSLLSIKHPQEQTRGIVVLLTGKQAICNIHRPYFTMV